MPKGATRLLQFEVDWSQFFKGRLNQMVPLEDAHDCGANTLLLLGRINEEFALELSMNQSMCGGHYTRANYLFPRFLFTEIERKYEYQLFDRSQDLLHFLEAELNEGYGTVLFMTSRHEEGHYVCIQKDVGGAVSVCDLQNERIIRNLDGYFDPYERFVVPTINLKRSLPNSPPKKSYKKRGGKTKKRRKN
jgi:hypothetical protein